MSDCQMHKASSLVALSPRENSDAAADAEMFFLLSLSHVVFGDCEAYLELHGKQGSLDEWITPSRAQS